MRLANVFVVIMGSFLFYSAITGAESESASDNISDSASNYSSGSNGSANSRLGKDRKLWWFVIKRTFMQDDSSLSVIRSALIVFAARHGTSKSGVSTIGSRYLGTFFFTVDLDFSVDTRRFWDNYKEYLVSYGEVPYQVRPRKIKQHIQAKPHPGGRMGRRGLLRNETIPEMRSRPNIGSAHRADRRDLSAIRVFEEPFDEMKKLSQPPNVGLEDLKGLYFTRKDGEGEGVTVYVPDSGGLVGYLHTHKILREVRVEDYIWAEPNPDDRITDTYRNNFHGTAVISKIAGLRIGTAPKAGIVVVQCSNFRGEITTAHYFSALLKIYDHIRQYNPGKPVIINISWTFDMIDPTNNAAAEIKEEHLPHRTSTNNIIQLYSYHLMGEFSKLKNVKIVGAAGNRSPGIELGFPQRHAQAFPYTMILVGGTGLDDRNRFQRSGNMRIWAPGTHIHVAGFDESGEETFEIVSGSSFVAAPTVTGIMASMISHGIQMENVVDLLYRLAHKRVPNGPPLVWNGINKWDWPSYKAQQERLEEYELP
ncbi:hypothetical protein TWF730_006043 [Orbilia blumenaviensis]|uniref:Peptidase S8/S53 domain-containing protein n=1 Tax=Orbilia blumenaviensis TaxID=1796055 RepID=A0AAV9VMF8_9PEZI